MSRTEECIQSVRLSDEQVSLLLEALDRNDKHNWDELRKFKRSPYRTSKLILHVLDNSQNIECSFRVVARNLSPDGMGFIHGQMIPPQKPVLVQIPRKDVGPMSILGHVVHCRHVDGMIHEVGVKFVGFARGRNLTTANLRPKIRR